MTRITFPLKEWPSIQARFKEGKTVYTIRVSNELNKYKLGERYITDWNDIIEIISIKKLVGGIKSLKKEYPYFETLDNEMIDELAPYDEMEIISLTKFEI